MSVNQKINNLLHTKDISLHDTKKNIIVVNGKNHRYNPNKPLSKILSSKIDKLTKTAEYNKQVNLIKATKGLQINRAISSYAIRNIKPKVEETKSSFKNYLNAQKISNIKLLALQGLSCVRTYESTLREFMRTHPGIRLVLDVALKVVDISAIEVLKKDKSINEKEYNILSNVNRYNDFKTELDKEKISQKKLIDIIERDNEATSLEKKEVEHMK